MMMRVSLFCCADERRVAKEEREPLRVRFEEKSSNSVMRRFFALYYAVLSFLF